MPHGEPLPFFRCTDCRRLHPDAACGLWDNVTVGAEIRRPKTDVPVGGGNSAFRFFYKCRCCRHSGQSRHSDLERTYYAQYGRAPKVTRETKVQIRATE